MSKWIKTHDGDLIDIEKFVMIRSIKDDDAYRIIGFAQGVAVDFEGDQHFDETEMFCVAKEYEAHSIMAAIEGLLKPYTFSKE